MNVIDCKFCGKTCLKHGRLAVSTGEDWVCYHHTKRVTHCFEYTYHKKGDCKTNPCCPRIIPGTIEVDWKKDESYYRAEWLIDGTFQLIKLNCGVILRLSEHPPNLTPENIEEKMSLWMTFS